jgi:hypothetical protein
MPAPSDPKIYHIAHVDRLAAIIADGALLSDAAVIASGRPGTTIGMGSIKQRRLTELESASRPGLFVGQCIPFYFCPRSIMLFLIYCANHPELTYRGGQEPIIHLECDLRAAVAWAEHERHRWAFTLSNARSRYFEDRADLDQLSEINWEAVATNRWPGSNISRQVKEGKQAEFLVEGSFPWSLVARVGVRTRAIAQQVSEAMRPSRHRPPVEVLPAWYY